MKVYCPFGLLESTGAFETKSKWLSNCIDNLHFILLHKHTNKKETPQKKNSSQHIQSSTGSSSYMSCKIYKKILLVFQSPLLYAIGSITHRPCSISYTAHTLYPLHERTTPLRSVTETLFVLPRYS